MSLWNDKGSSAGQSNMAGANQHMTNSIKDMVNLVDVFDLKLTAGHPNETLAKITHVENLKLNNDVMLFDVLVIPEYTGLKKGRVLGTGSEFGGLYLFDKEYNKSTVANNSPFEVCHKATQNMDSFSLSENKSTVFGQLMHLDVWGPYKVISREGFRYFLTIVDDYSRPNDDEEYSSCRDGSVHQSGPSHSLDQPEVDEQIPTSGSGSDLQGFENDGLITATPIDENTSSEGNVGFNDQWEHPPLAVGTYTASGNSLLAVGMPCALYSQQYGL
nr:ribonuclease H-like domain-containing protein [Tanacetum cinerariifolium]